jgi:phosphatidylserine decarboxylase
LRGCGRVDESEEQFASFEREGEESRRVEVGAMITRYGYDVFLTITALCVLAVVAAVLLVEPGAVSYTIVGLSVLLWAFSANFFRDPERSTPAGENLVISPADGKVIVVKNVQEGEYLHAEATLISIFMSPLNVHVNRNPVSGVVTHLRYVKGEYFAAFEDKASEKNEQMIIGIEHPRGKMLMKQIAGFVARRIVCTLNQGDSVRAGDRFGMVKFGSRVDVLLPVSAVVRVRVGDVSVAGETVLAEFR